MLTVGALAREFGLSRSTLLYYDRVGVLTPSGRSAAGYRRYDADDQRRLARICRYRRAGLPLATIQNLLDSPDADLAEALAHRLDLLNGELQRLRDQRRLILEYIKSEAGGRNACPRAALSGDRFVGLLTAAGVSRDQRTRWHAAFERADGEAHQTFLEFLWFHDEEIARIRRWSAEGGRAEDQEACDRSRSG